MARSSITARVMKSPLCFFTAAVDDGVVEGGVGSHGVSGGGSRAVLGREPLAPWGGGAFEDEVGVFDDLIGSGAFPSVLGEAGLHDVVEVGRVARGVDARELGAVEHHAAAVAGEGEVAGGHFVDRYAERPYVACLDGNGIGLEAFGPHVGEGSGANGALGLLAHG